MASDLSNELNYNAIPSQHSSIRMSRVQPLTNIPSSTGLVLSTSAQEVVFELPNKVYNLSKSVLNFKLEHPGVDTATYQNLFSLGQTLIDRVSLYTREGVYLCDMPFFNKFSRATVSALTKQDDMVGYDHSRGSTTAVLADTADSGFNVFKSNAASGVALVAGLGACAARVGAGGAAIEASDSAYVNPQYQITSALGVVGGANENMIYVSYSIPLNQIHHSLMSVNKVLYFGQSLLFRVFFAPYTTIGFQSSALVTASLTPIALPATLNIKSPQIMLAVETNPAIIQGLVNRVQSAGLQMMIPYTYGYRSSISGTNPSVQQRLNAGNGQRLLNMYSAVFNSNETGPSTSNDISNVANAKVVSVQTSLDNNNLQEYIPLCAENQDYTILKGILKDSLIDSANNYKYNRLWIDSWRKGKSCDWVDNDANEMDGISLTSERIWQAQYNTADTTHSAYTWAVCQRTMTISPNGQIIVS